MLYLNKLYIGIATAKSSALSISVLLIFKIQETNGALFLKANFLSHALLSGFATLTIPFTAIYTH